MRKRTLISLILTGIMILTASGIASAATWEYYFPITVSDNSSTTRTMYPVILEVGGQQLVDGGYITANGTDCRLRTTADKNLMLSTENITLVVDSLLPYGQVTYNLYTGYSPEKSDYQIIVGDGGYVTVDDEDSIELGDNFTIEQSGWVDTSSGVSSFSDDFDTDLWTDVGTPDIYVDTTSSWLYFFAQREATDERSYRQISFAKSLVDKPAAFRTYVSGTENITSTILTDTWSADFDFRYTAETHDAANRGLFYFGLTSTPENPNGAAGKSITMLLQWDNAVGSIRSALATSDGNQDIATNLAMNTTYYATLERTSAVQAKLSIFTDAARTAHIANSPQTQAIATIDDLSYVQASNYNAVDVAYSVTGWVDNLALTEGGVSVVATGVSSGEYIVTTRGIANSPVWATGDVLHFDGTNNSNVDCGPIYNAEGKLWVSLWFKTDDTFDSGAGADQYLWGKQITANDFFRLRLESSDGKLYLGKRLAAGAITSLATTQASWTGGQWYHVIASLSSAAGMRLRVDNGAAEDDVDNTAAPNGGDITIGNLGPTWGVGIVGQIQNVITGIDDLSDDEENDLYDGIAPADATDYWYLDEGAGTAITSYGTQENAGTADAVGTDWATSTYTTGKTGRLCDFTIQIGDDRWGGNVKGSPVCDTTSDWTFMRNNVMPYADNITMSVNGTLQLWFEPNAMITSTTLPDRATSVANDGTITWGSNDQIIIAFGEMESYEATTSTASANVTGFVFPTTGIPTNWWGMTFDGSDLPFYPTFFDTATETGIPLQTLYLIVVFAVAIAVATVTIVLTRSVVVGVAFYTAVMVYGANADIIAWWIIYVYLIMVAGIIFLSSRQAMGG